MTPSRDEEKLTVNEEAALRLRITEAVRELTASGVEHLSEADAEEYLADFIIGEVNRHRSPSATQEWPRGLSDTQLTHLNGCLGFPVSLRRLREGLELYAAECAARKSEPPK